jgi:hypothetical protein
MKHATARAVIDAYVRGQERMKGHSLPIELDGYTFAPGGKFQRCEFCRFFTINGRDWGDCPVRGTAHKDAHCNRLVVRSGV